MSESLDQEIQFLRNCFWSERDPEGRAFAPLADAYRTKGELDEAHLLVQDGLGRHPNFTTGHLVAARIARDRGDLVVAREHLDRVLDLDSGNILAMIDRAASAASEGDHEGALEDLRGALRLDPRHAEATSRLEALEGRRDWEPQVADVEEAEVPEPSGSIFTRTMGDIYARQGFLEKAIEVYEHLYGADPDNPELADRLVELREPPDRSEGTPGAPPEPSDQSDEESSQLEEAGAPAEDMAVHAETVQGDQQSIAQYFDDLLAWAPGAVPIESLAPDVTAHDADAMIDDEPPDAGFGPGETEAAAHFEPSSEDVELDAEEVEPGADVVTTLPEEIDDLRDLTSDPDGPSEAPEEGLDDFHLWLKSLQS